MDGPRLLRLEKLGQQRLSPLRSPAAPSPPPAPPRPPPYQPAVGLRVLTRQFFRMEHLTVLYLSKNNLSYIDPEMSHLKNLEVGAAAVAREGGDGGGGGGGIGGAGLFSWSRRLRPAGPRSVSPAERGGWSTRFTHFPPLPPSPLLPFPQILDLSYNKLRALPPEMGLMKSLKELLLYNNMIQTLPFELGNLFRIHTLGLQGNPLKFVWPGRSCCKSPSTDA